MGNILCKERMMDNNADAAPTVQTTSSNNNNRVVKDTPCGRCVQFCPTPFGRKPKDNYWTNHVFETVSPKNSQPHEDGWRNATLSLAESKNSNEHIVPPIAPPRKKRTQSTAADLIQSVTPSGIRNGFKDVFGKMNSRKVSAIEIEVAGTQQSGDKMATRDVHRLSSSGGDVDSVDFTDFSKDMPTSLSPNGTDKGVQPVSRVGNRKSDKFLGENLSDCLSIEPYLTETDRSVVAATTHEMDNIDRFVESNVLPPSTDKSSIIVAKAELHNVTSQPQENAEQQTRAIVGDAMDRKAEFLMAMLKDYKSNEDLEFVGREPVEEPLIVPRRRKSRHICDDDDHMHHMHQMLHDHESSSDTRRPVQPNTVEPATSWESSIVTTAVTPKKPNRDMEKYRQSQQELCALSPPAVQVRHDELPTLVTTAAEPVSPATRTVYMKPAQLNLSFSSTTSTKPNSLKRLDSMPAIPICQSPQPTTVDISHVVSIQAGAQETTDAKQKRILKKCKSSNSFLTQDLMDHIVHKVYGFEMNSTWLEHNGHGPCDGTKFVSPNSKLEKRKTSTISRQSSSSIAEEIEEPEPAATGGGTSPKEATFTIGGHNIVVADKKVVVIPEIKISRIVADELGEPPSEALVEATPKRDKENGASRKALDEASLDALLESTNVSADTLSDVLHDIYQNHANMLDDFKQYLEHDSATSDLQALNRSWENIDEGRQPSQSSKRTFSSTSASLDSSQETVALSPDSEIDELIIAAKGDLNVTPTPTPSPQLLNVKPNLTERRESIEDMDQWFLKHKSVQGILSEGRQGRRGSDGLVGYDTKKLFPFGSRPRERTLSASSEFFEDLSNYEKNNTSDTGTKTDEQDHSSLLKLLQQEKKIAS